MTTSSTDEQDQQQNGSSSSSSPTSSCSQCQKRATFMCSSCDQDGPRYCSIECQMKHWKEGGHYRTCKAARKTRQLHRQKVEASMGIESTSNVFYF